MKKEIRLGSPVSRGLNFRSDRIILSPPRMVASLYFVIGGHLKNPLCPITGMNPKVDFLKFSIFF